MDHRIEPLADGSGFTVRLPSGRRIGVSEYGDPSGRPMLWFPGTPGSRLSAPPDDALTRSRGVRYLAIERPGFGVSDPSPHRRVIDWPADVANVLDALDLDRVAIAGVSGAGPFLCACAAALSDRLTNVALIGVVGPPLPELMRAFPLWRRAAFSAFRNAPWLVEFAVGQSLERRGVEAFYQAMVRDVPPSDRAILDRIWSRQLAMIREALVQGPAAFAWETHIGGSPWGVDLTTIRVPVHVFQGEEDHAAPPAIGRYFARVIPDCHARFFPGEGHFLHHAHWGEILDAVTGSAPE